MGGMEWFGHFEPNKTSISTLETIASEINELFETFENEVCDN